MKVKGEYTAVIEEGDNGGYWAYCPEVPGANGQGDTIEATKENLAQAIELIFQDRYEDGMRGAPAGAILESVILG